MLKRIFAWIMKDFEFGRIDKEVVWVGLLPVHPAVVADLDLDSEEGRLFAKLAAGLGEGLQKEGGNQISI